MRYKPGTVTSDETVDQHRLLMHPLVLLAAMMLLSLMAVACDGSDEQASDGESETASDDDAEATEDDSESADPEPTTDEPADPEQLETVSFGVVALHTWYWALIAADEFALMEEHGIDLDLVPFSSASTANSALVSGDLQMVASSPDGAFNLAREDPDIRFIAGIVGASPYVMIGGPGITAPEDLQGGEVGTSGFVGADVLASTLILKEHGLEFEEDYNFVPSGDLGSRLAALQQGSINATVQFSPNVQRLLEGDDMSVIARGADYPRLENTLTIGILSRQDWIDQNPETAANFARGWLAAMEWLHDTNNRDEAVELLATTMNVSTEYAEETYVEFVEGGLYVREGFVEEERLEQTLDNLVELGVELPDDPRAVIDTSLFATATQGG